MRAPRLIAGDRRSAGHALLFCFCRPPGDSALGYWVLLSSRAPRLLRPARSLSTTTTFNPAPLSLDPATRRTEVHTPDMRPCTFADVTFILLILSIWRNLIILHPSPPLPSLHDSAFICNLRLGEIYSEEEGIWLNYFLKVRFLWMIFHLFPYELMDGFAGK